MFAETDANAVYGANATIRLFEFFYVDGHLENQYAAINAQFTHPLSHGEMRALVLLNEVAHATVSDLNSQHDPDSTPCNLAIVRACFRPSQDSPPTE